LRAVGVSAEDCEALLGQPMAGDNAIADVGHLLAQAGITTLCDYREVMSLNGRLRRFALGIVLLLSTAAVQAAQAELEGDAEVLARLMHPRRIVLLGEVHDNARHHTLRVEALARWIAGGARPALAFEQFDTERQPDIERARQQRPNDADYLIAQAKGSGDWQWDSYRPFIDLALMHGLPIVAANLSRRQAMKVARDGWTAVFAASLLNELGLDALPAAFLQAHEDAIAVGHCRRLPASILPAMARAQIARDIVLAQSLRPHLRRGIVLLAGNGHVRTDIGVPFWLTPEERDQTLSIGLLERGTPEAALGGTKPFNAYVITEGVDRSDPCKDVPELRRGKASQLSDQLVK
jgi:uncharacterized iron-regulated protein